VKLIARVDWITLSATDRERAMNKNDLIAEVAAKTGMSKRDAAIAVDAVFDTIAGSLKSGNAVKLPGFGNFGLAQRNSRLGRNPATGQPIQIPAQRVPKFSPSKNLRLAINGDPVAKP
jgi:DNA-binding protein HU-beta